MKTLDQLPKAEPIRKYNRYKRKSKSNIQIKNQCNGIIPWYKKGIKMKNKRILPSVVLCWYKKGRSLGNIEKPHFSK